MFWIQTGVICLLVAVFSKLLLDIFRNFGVKVNLAWYLMFPLWVFGLGFSLRLTTNKALIDLGYFITDLSTLFVTVLFTTFLFLGQLKYWKK